MESVGISFSEPSFMTAKRTDDVSIGSSGSGFTAGSGGRDASTGALRIVTSLNDAEPDSGNTGATGVLFNETVMSGVSFCIIVRVR